MVSYYICSFKWSLITGDLLNDILLQVIFFDGLLLQVVFHKWSVNRGDF